MTDTESKLAAIEANLFRFPTSFNDVRWLIAEVRRLQGENEKLTYYSSAGKMLLDMAESWYQDDGLPRENKLDDAINAWLRMRAARDEAIVDKEREYARGRDDAVKSIRAKAAEYDAMHAPTRFDLCFHYGDIADRLDSLAEAIERGEHVEGSDGR